MGLRIDHIRMVKAILRQLADPSCLDWISDGSCHPSKAVHGVPIRLEGGTQGKTGRRVLVVVVQGQDGKERRVNWRVPVPVLEMVLRTGALAIVERADVLEFVRAEHCDREGFLPWCSLGVKGIEWREGSEADIARHQAGERRERVLAGGGRWREGILVGND